jgi:cell surface protein SprA
MVLLLVSAGYAQESGGDSNNDSLPYPIKDRKFDKYSSGQSNNPFSLKDPSNVKSTVEYDPTNNRYDVSENMGQRFFRNPSYLTFDEFLKKEYDKSTKTYWKKRTSEDKLNKKKPLIPKIMVGGETFDRIFGGNFVDIKPQGSAELIFSWNTNQNKNPQLTLQQQKVSSFDFKEKIQMNVIANIGEKLKLTTNYNTEATFDFENQMKLEYTGYEDEIIKKIEAGNVSLPLNTSLITGSQSLFGIKTQLQFGRLTVTSIFAQQKGKTSSVDLAGGGAQLNNFSVTADNYEANKHYFLAQYFRNNFDTALSSLPLINSQITVNKVEVWVLSKTFSTEGRNIYAFTDLGERHVSNPAAIDSTFGIGSNPDNRANNLYNKLINLKQQNRDFNNVNPIFSESDGFALSRDYERVENARKLAPTDFTLNPKLGYISLNAPLNNDEVLAVAYEYTIGDQVYTVGELTTSGIAAPNALFVKLIKARTINTQSSLWKLMMKNIYNIGGFQIKADGFRLDIQYNDNSIGSKINYIPEGNIRNIPLIKVLNLDRINAQGAKQPDGLFDFIDGVTINSANGRVIFPVIEPFGSYLRKKIGDPVLAKKYAYDTLYTSTKSTAQLVLSQNKFSFRGSYQSSSSSEISLNAQNVPKGSVIVTAGGSKLVEDQDFTVDYTLGRVKIINEGVLASGAPIKISTESNALFSVQTKTLLGSRFDYKVSKDFTLGGTILNLSERPLTKKVNIGDEPINNTIFGFDGTYHTQSRFLTKMIDKIPFIDTKEISDITISAEYAQLIPGHASVIGSSGTSYIDDFEGSKSPIDLRSYSFWSMASVPQGQPSLFPNASKVNDRSYGFNRSNLSWFTVSTEFLRSGGGGPGYITDDDRSDPFIREVLETEIFPNKSIVAGQIATTPVFNLSFFPKLRGPYNYDIQGMNADGTLKNPTSNWAGIMRKVESPDFDATNTEFIEFWLMDPFIKGDNAGGDLYFNLGNVSEDVLHDNRLSFENGIPADLSDSNKVRATAWGLVPTTQPIVKAFDPNNIVKQDVGLDGVGNDDEKKFFQSKYIDQVTSAFPGNNQAVINANNDPSGDNYHSFRGADYDDAKTGILQRYRYYNGVDGNSINDGSNPPKAANNIPDAEDANGDNNLDQVESYYQYKVELRKDKMVNGTNYITSIVPATVKLANSKVVTVNWYQFKIPIRKPNQVIGSISDFKTIRFMRMFLTGFQDSTVCRFARLQLVRSEWRKYTDNLTTPGDGLGDNDNFDNTNFDLSTINLEEDGSREGIPYTLPPGIDRQVIQTSSTLQKLNEQSLLLKVCDLKDGDVRAGFKNTQFDIRNYKKLKMFVHAQSSDPAHPLKDNDLTVFVRLGSDFVDNYYEYEIPLKVTPPNSQSPDQIWLAANQLEVALAKLQDVKNQRNQNNWPLTQPYPPPSSAPNDGVNRITVKGVPNLSSVRTVMIGIRNPRKNGQVGDNDDGLSKCGEVWVNELRMSDFDESGGWAANARLSAKLADLGTFSFTGSRSTPGFGSIEQKLNERRKDDLTQYDVSTNLELGKFLPAKSGIKVPMYIGYGASISVPQYNPLDPDVKLKDYLGQLSSRARDSVSKITTDYTERKSINFTNVRKVKLSPSKPHFYDIENLNFTYAFSESFRSNVNIQNYTQRSYRGAIGYNFSHVPRNVTPFSFLKKGNRFTKPITDFNFNYAPTSMSFRADIDREYTENTLRDVTGGSITSGAESILTNYNKQFTINRLYNLKYDFAKSVKFDFNAMNNGVIDEPGGPLSDRKTYQDSLRKNILGRTTHYHHTGIVSWNTPINKLPYLDFTSLTVRYSGDYDWTAAPLATQTYGNTIQNATTLSLTSNLTMSTFYNKFSYFRKLNQKVIGGSGSGKTEGPNKDINKLFNKSLLSKPSGVADTSKKKKLEKDPTKLTVFDAIARAIVSIKSIGGTYSENNGTLLPGYNQNSNFLGMDQNTFAPGLGFVSGFQRAYDANGNIRRELSARDLLVKNDSLNAPFVQTHVVNYSLKANIEPFPGLRIDLTANKNQSQNNQEIYKYETLYQGGPAFYQSFGKAETGNLSFSFLSIFTAFEKEGDNHSSPTFNNLKFNTIEVSRRLALARGEKINPDSIYQYGYGRTSQDVLIPAFIAAYSGSDVSKTKLDVFKSLPSPNWRITYDGLSKLPLFQRFFNSITLGHAYRSNFSIGSYTRNLNYDPNSLNLNNNFQSEKQIGSASISEQFSPLISVDVTLKNSLSARFEIRKDRTMGLSFTNTQLTETNGKEYVFGTGYRFRKFKIPFKVFGRTIALDNDLDLKVDFSYRYSSTIIRRLAATQGQDTDTPTAGSNIISIKTSASYIVNERFNIQFFYDRVINKPLVSQSFETSTTMAGISIRFTLSQ